MKTIIIGLISFLMVPSISTAAAASEMPAFGTGAWDTAKLGHHRAVLQVEKASPRVRAAIPWRRPDADAARKGFLLFTAGGQPVQEYAIVRCDRERLQLVFAADSAGLYYVYYLPFQLLGSANYPQARYLPPANAEKSTPSRWRGLPEAKLVELQSSDEFNSFYPMEVIATAAEMKVLRQRHAAEPFLLFGEDRRNPIKMKDDLPLKWIQTGPFQPLQLRAARNEYYVFQLGVLAWKHGLDGLRVEFSDLRSAAGAVIAAADCTCFNLSGVDWSGQPFTRALHLAKDQVQALWCAVQIPARLAPGGYTGTVSVGADNAPAKKIELRIEVSDEFLADRGDSEPWRLSRLRWLNSRLAADDTVVKPFVPLTREGNAVSCLGRRLDLTAQGFPAQIRSFFAPALTHLQARDCELLSAPISFAAIDDAGRPLDWQAGGLEFSQPGAGRVCWQSTAAAGDLHMILKASMEFDGCVEYQVMVKSDRDIALKDMRLEAPLSRERMPYSMGLGLAGGFRPSEFRWRWQVNRNQDAIWLGDVHAGVQLSFKDQHYVRPLNTNFYQSKPLRMPVSWSNDGAGGIDLKNRDGQTLLLTAYSGPRRLKAGEELHFNFRLLLTPFKTLDTDSQWRQRYYHKYAPVEEIAATGANVINVHHATPINPYINYPFFKPAEMKAYADAAHARDMKLKIYYTVRELCNRAPELYALRSLGDEVLSGGPGGGYAWLQEHLRGDYIAAWFVPELQDAAVINSGVSRWHNFYVEGLAWLVGNVGIDGLYIDDVAFDRLIMKRVRRVLDNARPEALIDLHSANQYNYRDGFTSSANLYMEHFPYLNRLWFGEYFNYEAPPEYWLVEISGLPFGLMGEMLEGGGNPWRGMVFGMTSRLPWAGDPRPIWQAWDEFGMPGAQMHGWWLADNPLQTDRPEVLATVYAKKGKAMICLASWAAAREDVRLKINWRQLALNSAKARLRAPAMAGLQTATPLDWRGPITVEPGKGWLLILE